tara:strand:- start:204 stop:389 length:186 start_codon:yes stop_codon:yes gene_type:complete
VSRERAIDIVKNLHRTINNMIEVKVIPNDQFPGARADKQKLKKIKNNLIKKYKIEKLEINV